MRAVEKHQPQAIRKTCQVSASECCPHSQSEWTDYNLIDSENSETRDDFSKSIPSIQDSLTQDCLSSNQLKKRRVIDNPVFNSALDRTHLCSKAMMIIMSALAAAGVNVKEITMSARA